MNCLLEIPRQLDLFPEPVGEGGSLDRLHVEEDNAALLPDGGILGVGQGTGGPVAEAGEVVLIPAELLSLGLRFVLTEGLVDDRPDDVVVLHFCQSIFNFLYFCPIENLKKNSKLLNEDFLAK